MSTIIRVGYESIDSYGRIQWRTFKTLRGARAFAQRYLGETPEIGMGYAVSGDGVGKIVVNGATRLDDLFPKTREAPDVGCAPAGNREEYEDDEYNRQFVRGTVVPARPYRLAGCTCSDEQLVRVGCECEAGMPF